MTYGKGMILFAAEDIPENIEEAREYIKRINATQEDVKIVRCDGDLLVVCKRTFDVRTE